MLTEQSALNAEGSEPVLIQPAHNNDLAPLPFGVQHGENQAGNGTGSWRQLFELEAGNANIHGRKLPEQTDLEAEW